jgi:hypothetical protein
MEKVSNLFLCDSELKYAFFYDIFFTDIITIRQPEYLFLLHL